jgi:predicted amidohydrolase YtcJ
MPGMLADLAVLSDDYFSVELARVAQIRSVLTMVGGKVVYAAAPFAGMERSR